MSSTGMPITQLTQWTPSVTDEHTSIAEFILHIWRLLQRRLWWDLSFEALTPGIKQYLRSQGSLLPGRAWGFVVSTSKLHSDSTVKTK